MHDAKGCSSALCHAIALMHLPCFTRLLEQCQTKENTKHALAACLCVRMNDKYKKYYHQLMHLSIN